LLTGDGKKQCYDCFFFIRIKEQEGERKTMRIFKRNRFFLYLALGATFIFVLISSFETGLNGSQATSLMRISHTPVNYFIPGARIRVKALVSDEAGVMLVRCYFKAKGETDYVFVEMPEIVGNEYIGILPAPSVATSAIEYILLSVNQNALVVRSQVFEVKRDTGRETPVWQDVNMSGSVAVNTELARTPHSLPGFADNITANVVESAFRFGYVVKGIYMYSQRVGDAPAGAISGGTVSATTTKAISQAESTPEISRIPVTKRPATTPPQKKEGISPLIIVGGATLVAGGVLLATGVLGEKNLSVKIVVSDYGVIDNIFKVSLDGQVLGNTTAGGSGSWTRDLEKKSAHTLKVTNINGTSYCTISISNTNKSSEDRVWLIYNVPHTVAFRVNEAK
jgi:hypothetical protein